ncbi:MAG TPA: alkaline phosphatase family protein, partial [Leptospiraceae bacterium]|nr:alkaline phosphatase family protein [Leptospiraceae bacterium]
MKNLFALFSILFLNFCMPVISRDRNPSSGKKLIVLSIDGFPGYYLKEGSAVLQIMPNLKKLLSRSVHSNQVSTVYPSLTFPAHTSMITGADPAKHGIFYNNPP